MVRSVTLIGVVCAMTLGLPVVAAPVFAAEVPQELQGRWGKPADCKKKDEGLRLEPHKMSFGGTAAQRITLTVEAHDLHSGRAMLTIKSIAGAPITPGGPQVGDHLVLQRTGDHLQPIEVISAGRKTDTTFEPAISLCS